MSLLRVLEDKVVDSRESKEAESIRRRRECLKCGKRFTTYERIDEIPYMVVKKDGRREKFDRQKVLNGLLRACEKRPVPIGKLEQIVNEAEGFVIESPERERKTSEVGELIMNRLRRYDKVAYVRFASVYLDFKDVQEFMSELKDLLKTKDITEAAPRLQSKADHRAQEFARRPAHRIRTLWPIGSLSFPATALAPKSPTRPCASSKPPA